MNSSIKKIILFVAVLILSYLTAPYVGRWYDTLSFQHGDWIIGRNQAVFFAGFIISYIFFLPLIYGLFGIKRNKHWITWPLLPAALLVLGSDKYHFYIPVLLILVALGLAWVSRLIFKKFKKPEV